MTDFTGWPYQPKRYQTRITFLASDGRRPEVRSVIKGKNLHMVKAKALKIARSFFLRDPKVHDAEYKIEVISLREDPPSVYSGARHD